MELNPILARFKSIPLEESYNNHYIRQDRIQAIIGILILIVAMCIFVYSDYILFHLTYKFFELLFIRILFISFSIYLIFRFWHLENFTIYFRFMLVWTLVLCVFTFYINISRPPDYIQNGMIDIIIIVALYIFFPNRFMCQIISGLLYSILDLWIIISLKTTVTPIAMIVIWVSFIIANVLGILGAWRLHIYRRKQYGIWIKDKQHREELQTALKNVKTLQGLLPVCSRCKKIRDSKGYWEQIDTYFEKHSDIEFTHGLCESCENELYGNEGWFKKKNSPKD